MRRLGATLLNSIALACLEVASRTKYIHLRGASSEGAGSLIQSLFLRGLVLLASS